MKYRGNRPSCRSVLSQGNAIPAKLRFCMKNAKGCSPFLYRGFALIGKPAVLRRMPAKRCSIISASIIDNAYHGISTANRMLPSLISIIRLTSMMLKNEVNRRRRAALYEPPFTRTARMDYLCMEIAEMVGRLTPVSEMSTSPVLHRKLRIQTIHSSLVVEGNTLTVEQVTAILDGKRVLGNRDDIREVENADRAYALLFALDPYLLSDLLRIHKEMTEGLVPTAGRFRDANAGVFDGDRLIHMGTPAHYVPQVMADLFSWLERTELHPLLSSCIFHYEFEFIHPFADGNGRTGRLWHTLLLSKWRDVLAWLPVESVILRTQQRYYGAFAASESRGDCAPFVEYMLEAIREALEPYCRMKSDVELREEALLDFVHEHPEATLARISEHLGVSRATADRTVASLRASGRLTREGSKRSGRWIVSDPV